jgi:hypothetical protein
MATLFHTQERIVPTWLAAARYLNTAPRRQANNLLLEITSPLELTESDRKMMASVDQALLAKGLTLRTVAGTIFPIDLYKRFGRPAYYEKYMSMLKRGKKRGSWGTYAARMIDRPGKNYGESINPLEMLVYRLSDEGQPQKKDGGNLSYPSAYELGVSDPEDDLACEDTEDSGGDVPTFNSAFDGRQWLGMPCLSHLSFKRVPINGGHAVDLTAVYRSHHYCARALGNLIGLGQLLSFVATESGLSVGTLSCLSTHAELDVKEWGGVKNANFILAG